MAEDKSLDFGVGDRVRFRGEKQAYTVRGVTRRGRFVVCTKPFNLRRTVLYSVIDTDRGVRGRDDHHGLGYESDEQVTAALHAFQHTEDGEDSLSGECEGCPYGVRAAEVSHRTANHVRLEIEEHGRG